MKISKQQKKQREPIKKNVSAIQEIVEKKIKKIKNITTSDPLGKHENEDPFSVRLRVCEDTYWVVEPDPKTTYKFNEVKISKSGCFILPEGTHRKKLVIGLIVKFDSQDLHYRSWHNILVTLVKKQDDIPPHRLREELNPWATTKIEPKTDSYWFSEDYNIDVKSEKSEKKWSLPCFTLYISTSHFGSEEKLRYLKFNRHIRRAQKSALNILNKQYAAELKIREKNPWLKNNRDEQWKKALDSIKKALSRSIEGWQIDNDDEPPVLFEPRVKLHGDILANGDSIRGYITIKQVLIEPQKESSEPEPPVHYIVIIKNEDLIDGCESREKFLSERYAALISLIEGNKDKDLPVFDGLIEVFSLQDKRKDLWKKHLNLTEFHPDAKYNPISLLVEMGGDVFYEPILVNNEKAYSVFYNEMLATGKFKKDTDE